MKNILNNNVEHLLEEEFLYEDEDESELSFEEYDSHNNLEQDFFTDVVDDTTKLELSIFLDTEFQQLDLDTNIPICFQALISFNLNNKNYRFLMIAYDISLKNDDLYKSKYKNLDLYKFYIDLKNQTKDYHLLNCFLKVFFNEYDFKLTNLNKLHFSTNIYFYFSLKDLNISLGSQNMKDIYTGKKKSTLKQYNSVQGSFDVLLDQFRHNVSFSVKLKDLFGINTQGLQSLAESYEIDFKKSALLEPFKSEMTKALSLYPLEFENYALEDCLVLEPILEKYVFSSNNILKEVFYIEDETAFYSLKSIPLTVGYLVYSFYKKFLDYKVFKNDPYLKLAIYSSGVLNPLSKTYNQNLDALALLKEYKTLESLKSCSKEHFDQLSILLKNKDIWKYFPWQFCSTKFFQEISHNTSLLSLSFVSGGRITNERPLECYSENGCDIDISSAYGSVLEKIGLPLGKPRLLYYTPNQRKFLSLKQFLKKYPCNSDYWKVVVEGSLTFDQDFLFSRIISDNFFSRKLDDFDEKDPSTYSSKGSFALLRRQLQNATITAPLWDLLKKVSTSKELAEIYKLKVTSAVYYDKKDCLSTIEELADTFLSNQKKERSLNDSLLEFETYKWIDLGFSSFISTLIKKRFELKKLNLNKSLQNTIKLIVNSFYGILCSPFFDVNNILVSDLITSTIRKRIWMMSKSLNLFINVTDGGFFSLDHVLTYNKKKPGLSAFSNIPESLKKSILRTKSLGDKEKNYFKNMFSNLEGKDNTLLKNDISSFSKKHMLDFWNPYELDIDFDLEVKEIYLKASYLFKAHYMFKNFDFNLNKWSDTPYYKIRGYKFNEYFEIQNPIYDLLNHILKNGFNSLKQSYNVYTGIYKTKKLIKYRSWKLQYRLNPSITYLPGDVIFLDSQFRMNNLHFPINDSLEYNKRSKRGFRKKKGQEEAKTDLFEKFLKTNSLDLMLLRMSEDNLRSNYTS
jgi:hypothetical protein